MKIFERDDITREELNEELKECMETSHIIKKNFPLRMYNMAKEEYERNKKEEEIINKMYKDHRRKVKKVTIINDDMAIVETFEKLFGEVEKPWFRIYYNGRIDSTVTDNFDSALIQLVCIKNKCESASGWICKMLDIKEDI